jgi:hypothetical protein
LSKYVELESHVGIHLISKREVVHEQYFVYIKDEQTKARERIGLIGWKKGSKLIFTAKLDPTIKKWVQEEVANLLNKEKVESVDPPTATQELLAAQHQGSDDELNEEDLTQ